jgi:hypothetical protein
MRWFDLSVRLVDISIYASYLGVAGMLCVFVQSNHIVLRYQDAISTAFDVVSEFHCSTMIYLVRK